MTDLYNEYITEFTKVYRFFKNLGLTDIDKFAIVQNTSGNYYLKRVMK